MLYFYCEWLMSILKHDTVLIFLLPLHANCGLFYVSIVAMHLDCLLISNWNALEAAGSHIDHL